MRFKSFISILAVAIALTLTACSNSTQETPKGKDNSSSSETTAGDESSLEDAKYPITIKHAFGETVIERKPERVATIFWGNQDTPLALGVVPVGASEANYGVIDGSGMLPWTKEGFKDLGEENPTLFQDTDGLDYEAISDVAPDVILAAYSGISKEEYDLLSQIAPVVAYPSFPWQTYWREQITMDATGIGMQEEGEQLVQDLEDLIEEKVNEYPQLKGKKAAFFYFNPSDLGKFYIYLPADPRAAYLIDLGMEFPDSLLDYAEDSESFSIELSSENADELKDIDIIIGYGDEALLKALQADPLMGTIPAIKRGSVAMLKDGTPIAASSTPSALSIPATIDEYLKILGEAADKVQ